MTKEEQKAYNAAYYKKNRERLLASFCQWKEDNRDRHRATSAKWQADNPEKSSAIKRAYKKAHPEMVIASSKRKTPESLKSHAARQSVRNRIVQAKTSPEVTAIYVFSASEAVIPCVWCGTLTAKGGRHVDHRIPIAKGGTHSADNLGIACKSCNLKKGSLNPDEFRARRTS